MIVLHGISCAPIFVSLLCAMNGMREEALSFAAVGAAMHLAIISWKLIRDQ